MINNAKINMAKSKLSWRIKEIHCICLMILEKMRSCLWKLELRFWTYGWKRLLGPSGPNVVSKPQTPKLRHFLKFHTLIGFVFWSNSRKNEVLPVKIEARVLELWLDMSFFIYFFLLIGIHSVQGWTATTRHGVTRKEA